MKIHFTFLISIFLTIPGFAADKQDAVASKDVPATIQEKIDRSGQETGEINENADPNSSTSLDYICTAWTQCLSGRQISCWSRGAACRATAYTASSVICEAWGIYGNYNYAVNTCY